MNSFTDLTHIAGAENVRFGVPGRELTTFRTGGPVSLLVSPKDEDMLRAVLSYVKERGIPYFLIGRGSNLLIGDGGYDGVMISLRPHFQRVRIEGTRMIAGGGAMLSECAKACLSASLSGFEFASGIPGTVGGGLFMNAGAYGSELSDLVESAKVLSEDGQITVFGKDGLELSYRSSILQRNGGMVLEAVFALRAGDPAEIRALMNDLAERRRTKQPLEYASAGSTFKRPAGYFAGKLIEDAGMKGYRKGDAGVSEKHAGFVVNYGHATAREIREVMQDVTDRVFEQSRVTLVPEVRMIGTFL